MSGFTIVPTSQPCRALDGGLPIIDVHIMDEKLEDPLGVFNYELVPVGGRSKKRALELVEEAEWPGWTFGS